MAVCLSVNKYCVSFHETSSLGALKSKLVSHMETYGQWQLYPSLIMGEKAEELKTQILFMTMRVFEFFPGRRWTWKNSTFSATSLKILLTLWLWEGWMGGWQTSAHFCLSFLTLTGDKIAQMGSTGVLAPITLSYDAYLSCPFCWQ